MKKQLASASYDQNGLGVTAFTVVLCNVQVTSSHHFILEHGGANIKFHEHHQHALQLIEFSLYLIIITNTSRIFFTFVYHWLVQIFQCTPIFSSILMFSFSLSCNPG